MSDNSIMIIPNSQNISQIHFKSIKENKDKETCSELISNHSQLTPSLNFISTLICPLFIGSNDKQPHRSHALQMDWLQSLNFFLAYREVTVNNDLA